MKTAELIIDWPRRNADLYYATHFLTPDPFIYFKTGGRKYMIMTDLELDRAKKTADVHTVLSYSKYLEKVKKRQKNPADADIVIAALKERRVRKLIVPDSMPFTTVDRLRKNGFRVEAGPNPFYASRSIKNNKEMKNILLSQKAVYSAMRLTEDMIRKSRIRKNMLYLNGRPLTSEKIREAIELHLCEKGCVITEGTIVSCGKDSAEPHNLGSGPLRPHQAIIIDIFPRSSNTLFFGDATRTFCKGKAPERLKKMYLAVKIAQENAITKIRAGINGRKIHEGIVDHFKKAGFTTSEMNGRKQGFIHGTGHGVGLEIHEAPVVIRPADYILKAGNVTSVEPGLYYAKIGGVRIEDLVYVTKTGCRVIGSYPKKLEIR